MKFKMIFVLLILSIILTMSSVSAVGDNDIVLDEINENDQIIGEVEINGDNDISGSGTSEGDVLSAPETYTFTDLDNKIRSATGDNVTISGTYRYDPNRDIWPPIGIKIEKNRNFTIIGDNLVIDGYGLSSGFNIQPQYSGYITLYNITFINCNNKDGNGGAVFSSMPFNISHCRFENNVAGISGGAVYTTLTQHSEYQSVIEYCNFTNNIAKADSDAVYWKTYNKDYFSNNYFTNHNNGKNVFKLEGNDAYLAAMNFVNNTAKVCMDLSGNNFTVGGSQSSNNTGISVRIIGNDSQILGSTFNNTDLDNEDYTLVIDGENIFFGGVNVYSPKSFESNCPSTQVGGSLFSGYVICHGDLGGGGLYINGDLTVDGNSQCSGWEINGSFISNGNAYIAGVVVREDLILNGDSTINSGQFNRVYNNHGNLNLIVAQGFDVINNGGTVNVTIYNCTGYNFTNNGGTIVSEVGTYPRNFNNCSFVNNGGELKFDGTVNLLNCSIDGGKVENYDLLNIIDGSMTNVNLVNNMGTVNIINVSSAENLAILNKANLNVQGSNLTNCSLSNSGEISISDDSKMDDIKKVDTTVTATKVSLNYGARKNLSIKITDKSGNPIKNTKFTVTINKKKYYATSDANGIATVKIPVLKVGTYKVAIIGENEYCNIQTIYTTVKVNKAKTTVKMAKAVKKNKKYQITIKSKVTKKAVRYVKIKVKVYTGKNVKTYKIKTNKKGIAKLSTKKLSRGKHKIIVSSLNKNYKISKKTTFKIK